MPDQLWFDVEERYNTTANPSREVDSGLWFDVEERYNTTPSKMPKIERGCGLM